MGFFPVISNPTLYRYGQRLLIAAILLSLLFHGAGVLVWGYIAGLFPWFAPKPKPERLVVLSSATTITRRTVPVPIQLHHQSSTQAVPQEAPRALAAQGEERAVVAVATPPRRELTYTAPSAPPQPRVERAQPRPAAPRSPLSPLQQAEVSFQHEVAQFHARDNPLSVATIAPRPASAYRRSYVNISGIDRNQETYQGIVTPTQTWLEGQQRCHYASYDVEYSTGASDKGNIPWPLCYAPDRDPMMLPDGQPVPNGSPVPARDLYPMDGYTLPPGTYLTQFLRQLYNRQI